MKNYLIFAFVALISIFAGYSLRPAAVSDPDAAKFRELKSKMETIGQVDVEEYLRLKDQKSRYEKADEIMGKILMLMLYDLGIRKSEGQLAKMKERIGGSHSELPALPLPAEDTKFAADLPAKAKQTANSQPAAKPDWRQNAEKAKEVYRADQVEDFLKSVEISDLFGAMKSGTTLSESQIDMINGNFTGRAVFEDPKEVPWNVFIRVDAQMQDGQAWGDFDVRLTKNGKQFSHTRSSRKRGEKNPIKSDNFMALDGDPNSVIINAYGDDGFFQLYFFPRLNEFHGLVYLKKSLGVFERKGVVHLTKN